METVMIIRAGPRLASGSLYKHRLSYSRARTNFCCSSVSRFLEGITDLPGMNEGEFNVVGFAPFAGLPFHRKDKK